MADNVNEKNYPLKTFLCDAALLVFALLCMFVVTLDCKTTWLLDGMTQSLVKLLAFLAVDVLLAAISYRAVKNSSKKTQIWIVTAVAIAVTVISILLNNMWHYIYMYWNFDWLEPISYWWVVRQDITYLDGLGLYRYFLVCLGYIISFFILKKEIFNQIREYVRNVR